MNGKIEIVERKTVHCLEIAAMAPAYRIPAVCSKAYRSIAGYIEQKGITISEAPYIRYRNINWAEANNAGKLKLFIQMFTKKWDMLIGFPVPDPTAGQNEITRGEIPAGRYAQIKHTGSYKSVGDSYTKLTTDLENQKLAYESESIEFYLNDPQDTPEDKLETLVLIRLR